MTSKSIEHSLGDIQFSIGLNGRMSMRLPQYIHVRVLVKLLLCACIDVLSSSTKGQTKDEFPINGAAVTPNDTIL